MMTPNEFYNLLTEAGYGTEVGEKASAVLRGRDVPARLDALVDLFDYMGLLGPVTK